MLKLEQQRKIMLFSSCSEGLHEGIPDAPGGDNSSVSGCSLTAYGSITLEVELEVFKKITSSTFILLVSTVSWDGCGKGKEQCPWKL